MAGNKEKTFGDFYKPNADDPEFAQGVDKVVGKVFDKVGEVGRNVIAVQEESLEAMRANIPTDVPEDFESMIAFLTALPPAGLLTAGERPSEEQILEILEAAKPLLEQRASSGGAQNRRSQTDLAIVEDMLQHRTGGQTEVDALPQDTEVATEQVADATGWDSIEGRAKHSYNFDFTTADLIRNPGNLRPAGWGTESGAIKPDSDLGEALLEASKDNPDSSRQYFIGSYKSGKPVAKDHAEAVVLIRTKSKVFHVFDTYENGMKAQVENITRQVVGKNKNNLTVDGLVEIWAPAKDGNTLEQRTGYKNTVRQAFRDFGLDLTNDKVDATDARHIVAIAVGMWRHEAGGGDPRITGQDILNALKKSKMAVGSEGRSGSNGLSNLENLSISVTDGKISLNNSAPVDIR